MLVSRHLDGPGHKVMDTGMQLLTHCGFRVTYIGCELDSRDWVSVARLGCFECQPSPMIEWAKPQAGT